MDGKGLYGRVVSCFNHVSCGWCREGPSPVSFRQIPVVLRVSSHQCPLEWVADKPNVEVSKKVRMLVRIFDLCSHLKDGVVISSMVETEVFRVPKELFSNF